ncbi:MAG: hypothetical protein ACKOFW_11070, partial [Planctomycetaceae bacterium]
GCLTGCLALQPGQRSTFRLVEPVAPQDGLPADAPLGAQPGRALRPGRDPVGNAPNHTLDKRTFPTPVEPPPDQSPPRRPDLGRNAPRLSEPTEPPSGGTPSSDLWPEEPGGSRSAEPRDPSGHPLGGGINSELLESPEEAFRAYRQETRSAPQGRLSPPEIDLEGVVAEGELELEVRGPKQAPRGKLATFEITLRNGTQQPVRQVGVRCQIPEGVSFPGTETREVTAQTPLLEAGETRQWTLSLRMDQVGSQCCEFRLLPPSSPAPQPAPGRLRKQVCVEVVERQFSIDVLGPARRLEGGRAEFVIVVGNPSAAPRERVQVRLTHDRALTLRETTEQALRTPDGLEWELGTLAPGTTRQVQVEFDCQAVAGRAGVQVEVLAQGQAPERAEAAVEIAAQTGPLDLQLWDQTEPVLIGRRGVYQLKLRNVALAPARQVKLEMRLPPEVVVLAARLKRGDTELEAQHTVREGHLVFDAIEELPAEESLEGVIEVEGLSPGRVEVRATATSEGLAPPVESTEQTLVEAE